jgi:hypothetical protein
MENDRHWQKKVFTLNNIFKNVLLIKESANKTAKFFFLKYINLGVKKFKIYFKIKFVDTSSKKAMKKDIGKLPCEVVFFPLLHFFTMTFTYHFFRNFSSILYQRI